MTYLIKDVYIDIEKLPEEMEEINVDKGEVLKLKFGKFYPNSKDNRKLQINVGNSGWVDLKLNAGKQITSEGEIEITFDEIVKSVCGNGDSFDEKYVKCTAKTIDIRAVKKLLDGVQTHGQIVSCQFYQKGPEFEILKVRSPSCGGVSIKVKMKKEDFDNYSKNGFEWRIKRIDPKPNNFSAEFILNSGSAQYDENNGVIDLSDIKSKKKDGELQKTLMEFLESDNSNYPSTWEMQLAIINDGGEEASTEGRSFHVEKFTIPERLNPIKIDADPVINNNEKNDADNPYLLLEKGKLIDDDDSQPKKRLEYNVECGDANNNFTNVYTIHSLHEDNLSVEEELKPIFNSENKEYSYDIEEDEFKKLKFDEWYDKQSVEIRSTIKIDKSEYDATAYINAWEPNPFIGYFLFLGKECEVDGDTYTYLYRIDHRDDNNPVVLIVFKGSIGIDIVDSYEISYTKVINRENYEYVKKYSIKENGNFYIYGNYVNGQYSPDIVETTPTQLEYTFEYLGKGCGYFFVKYLDEYGRTNTGVVQLDGDQILRRSFGTVYNSQLNLDRYTTFVANYDLIVIQNGYNGSKKVLHDMYGNGGVYGTYHDYTPYLYSYRSYDNGNGFTYIVYNEKYYRRYNPFSKDELYEYFKTGQVINCPSDKFDGDWDKFCDDRDSEWSKFLKFNNSIKISNIPKNNYLSEYSGKTAYSGYLRIKDADECYSNTIKYVYYYTDDLSYEVIVEKTPTLKVGNGGIVESNDDGEVKLVYKGGSYGPYKYNDGNTDKDFNSSNSITIENLPIEFQK